MAKAKISSKKVMRWVWIGVCIIMLLAMVIFTVLPGLNSVQYSI